MGIRYLKTDWCWECSLSLNIRTLARGFLHVVTLVMCMRKMVVILVVRVLKQEERVRHWYVACTKLDAEALKEWEGGGIATYRKKHFTACSSPLLLDWGLVTIHVSERRKTRRTENKNGFNIVRHCWTDTRNYKIPNRKSILKRQLNQYSKTIVMWLRKQS